MYIFAAETTQTIQTMKTLKMLPYGWKRIGRVLLVLCVLLFAVCFQAVSQEFFWSKYVADAFGAGWASTLIVLLFCIAVVLMAFSQEREEDERISVIRQQALVRTVILYVAVVFLCAISNLVLYRLFDSRETLAHIMIIRRFFTTLSAFMLYYLLIFKVSLWSENKKLRDEE